MKPLLSRHGLYRGFVLGPAGDCSAVGCDGRFLSVDWEFGYEMRLCTTGIRELSTHYRIFDGGEIDARWVTPVDPPGVDVWPPFREEVATQIDWSKIYAESSAEGFESLIDQI